MKLPARPEQFARRTDEMVMACKDGMMPRIPGWFAFHCKILLVSYYGGWFRTGLSFMRDGLRLWASGKWTALLLLITDGVGWTKLYEVPETATHIAHWQRHGRFCSGSPNCNNMDCINEGVPRWFRKVTCWDR